MGRMRAFLAGLWVLVVALAACGDPPVDFAGRFANDHLTLELRGVEDGYIGAAEFGGKRCPAKAHVRDAVLDGAFVSDGRATAFTATLDGDRLSFSIGAATQVLVRATGGRPVVAAQPPATVTAAAPAVVPASAPAEPAPATPVTRPPPPPVDTGLPDVPSNAYESVVGFGFRYPATWTLAETRDGPLTLTPPNVRRDERGVNEIYLAIREGADGVTEITDPRVAQHLDELVRASLPFLARKGDAQGLRSGGRDGVALRWEGAGQNGDVVVAHAWLTILEKSVVGLVAICSAEAFDQRRAALESIFSTFTYDQPPRDPALVGLWRYEKSYFSGTFSSTTIRHMGLYADGTSTWGGRLLAGMEHTGSGGEVTGTTSADTGDGVESRGHWSGANKTLFIEWDGGAEETFAYYIEGGSMLLTPSDGGKQQLWQRVR